MEILAWGLCVLEVLVYTLALGVMLSAITAFDAGMIGSGQATALVFLSGFCTGAMLLVRRGLDL